MDFKNNMMNQNEQLLEAQKQKDVFIQTTKNVNEEVQEEKKEIGVVPAEVLTNEQMKQQNINAIREMEKMSKEEKITFTKIMSKGAESSGQLQKDRRIAGLKKSQRKEIAQGMKAREEVKERELLRIQSDRSTLEKNLYASYFSDEHREVFKRERMDVTGYERRNRAALNKKLVMTTKKNQEQDLNNLIHNMRMDALMEKKYEPDMRLEKIRRVAIFYDKFLKTTDYTLGNQIANLEKKQEDPNFVWPVDKVEVPKESREILKERKSRFDAVQLHLKNTTQNFAVKLEIQRSHLRAMEMAKKQLIEDNELQPSAYTQKLITEIEKKIVVQQSEVEKTYSSIERPSENPEVLARVEAFNKLYDQLYKKADEIEKAKKELDGMRGKALKGLQRKAMERKKEELRIKNREAESLILNIRF